MGFIGVRVQRFKDEGVSGFACLTKVFNCLGFWIPWSIALGLSSFGLGLRFCRLFVSWFRSFGLSGWGL